MTILEWAKQYPDVVESIFGCKEEELETFLQENSMAEKYIQAATTEYVERMIFEATHPKVPCLICGEDVPLTSEERDRNTKVCDKCKAAIMQVRRGMENPHGMIMD